MDLSIIKTEIPRWWRGVRKNHVAVQGNFKPIFFDTETCVGKVFATGIFDGDKFAYLHGLDHDHFRFLLRELLRLAGQHNGTVVAAAHALLFDLGHLVFPFVRGPWAGQTFKAPTHLHFSLLEPRCTLELFVDRPCFGRITVPGQKITIHLIDTLAFYSCSLDKALRAIGSPIRKLPKPKQLGYRVIPWPELKPYLAGDVVGGFSLLQHVLALHRKWDVRLCVSSPSLAGRIFRHHFLKKDFVRPSGLLMASAMLSYHGGKNSFPAETGWYPGCWDLDLRSAFAGAMAQLPDFEHGRWRRGKGLEFVRAHPHGIYRVRGWVKPCKWGILFDHGFKRTFGAVPGIWVTGYELLEAVDSGHLVQIREIAGWGFHSKSKKAPALKRYVEHFFRLKEAATDPAERDFAKHMLTDLYGKFIARHENDDGEKVAGAMFDPTIASLITGYVRAQVHRLEHKYDALHTATDGLITQRRPDPKDLGAGLGQLKIEAEGTALILRNKLYMIFGPPEGGRPRKSAPHVGRLLRAGYHGFDRARPGETARQMGARLLKLYQSAQRIGAGPVRYTPERLVRWAEAWHIGIPPGTPWRRQKSLHLKPAPGRIQTSERPRNGEETRSSRAAAAARA